MLDRFVSIHRPVADPRRDKLVWRLLPQTDRLRVWEITTTSSTDAAEAPAQRQTHFHVDFRDNIERGMRVLFVGELFEIERVSDSKLRGLELTCSKITSPA